MSSPLVTVQRADDLEHVVRRFADDRIHGAVVVDERGHPVGVLSLFDVVQQLANLERPIAHPGSFYEQRLVDVDESEQGWEGSVSRRDDDLLQDITAGDMMTPEIISAPRTATLPELGQLMAGRGIHRILITGDGDKLVGIVSALDLVNAICGSASA